MTTTKELTLTRGLVAVVDAIDHAALAAHKWTVQDSKVAGLWYAKRTVGPKVARRSILLHREIMGLGPDGPRVDHINGDGLDNRRVNLRLATAWQNLANQRKTRGSSRFKGVSWDARPRKWRVSAQGRYVGLFDDEETAARAYDIAALARFGSFARLNFGRVA